MPFLAGTGRRTTPWQRALGQSGVTGRQANGTATAFTRGTVLCKARGLVEHTLARAGCLGRPGAKRHANGMGTPLAHARDRSRREVSAACVQFLVLSVSLLAADQGVFRPSAGVLGAERRRMASGAYAPCCRPCAPSVSPRSRAGCWLEEACRPARSSSVARS